ncbi:MAG: hypothetical protein LQ344_002812 [Seirophora lacunosa]|nr:MAG: hypothetical protein LQ344_002812 [Seirophora lacunosa]
MPDRMYPREPARPEKPAELEEDWKAAMDNMNKEYFTFGGPKSERPPPGEGDNHLHNMLIEHIKFEWDQGLHGEEYPPKQELLGKVRKAVTEKLGEWSYGIDVRNPDGEVEPIGQYILNMRKEYVRLWRDEHETKLFQELKEFIERPKPETRSLEDTG